MNSEDKPAVLAEGPFEVLALRIRREGESYGGTLLRETASSSATVCAACGLLPDPYGRKTTDWMALCHAAMAHAGETGHRIAVESRQGAVYGPGERLAD